MLCAFLLGSHTRTRCGRGVGGFWGGLGGGLKTLDVQYIIVHTNFVYAMFADGINPNIVKFLRQWQWRLHQNKDDLLTKLGQKLSHRL